MKVEVVALFVLTKGAAKMNSVSRFAHHESYSCCSFYSSEFLKIKYQIESAAT